MKRPVTIPVLWGILSAHVVVDLALLAWPWKLMSDAPAAALAWPISQISVAALWAALGRGPSAVRFAGCLAATALAWLLLIVMLPDLAVHDRESAGWAAACATQAAAVVLAVAIGRWAWLRIASRQKAARGSAARPLQFSVGFLLLWTAAVALLLGLGRTAVTRLGWTGEVTHWLYFLFMPVFGAGNAAVAVVVLVALCGRRGLAARVAVSLIVVALVGYSQPYLLKWLTTGTGGMSRANAVTLAVAQAAYLYGTLLPLRRIAGGWIGMQNHCDMAGNPRRRPRPGRR